MIYCLVLQSGHCEIAHKSNRFLSHLFHKYGSHGTISFEVSVLMSISHLNKRIIVLKKKNYEKHKPKSKVFKVFV